MKTLILLVLTLCIFSCSDPDTESEKCIDNMITLLEMEAYTGEMGSDCNTYLRWSTYDGNDYFMIDNPCADFVLHLWDCEKVDVCQDFSSHCQEILANMTSHGIVGR